jgi:hypothetical protein
MPAPHNPKEAAVPHTPTLRQLSYLKRLADRTGQTFTYPHTSGQASAEIHRLKTTQPSSRIERYVERKAVADQIATGPLHDGTRVRKDEISGHGSTATWTQNRDQEPELTEEPQAPRRAAASVSDRVELARYELIDGTRVIYGQRVDGIVRVTDRPLNRGGRSYLIDRGLHSHQELQALVSDYAAQAKQLGRPPLSVRPRHGALAAAA